MGPGIRQGPPDGFRPRLAGGLFKDAHGAVDEHGFCVQNGLPVDAGGFHGGDVRRDAAQGRLLPPAVLHPGQVRRQGDPLAVLGVELPCFCNVLAVIGLHDKVHAALADFLPQGGEKNVAHKAAGENLVRRAPFQDGFHHQEGVGNLCPAQHEHAGPVRVLHDLRDGAELLFEEPSHTGGQDLLEAAEAGLVPVGGGEGVADVEVRQGGQLLHQQGFRLLLVGQAELHFEEGLLLGHEADVVQKEDFAVFQIPDRRPGGGAADVVDPLHFFAQQAGQYLRMGLRRIIILIFDVAALVGQEDHLRSFF